MSVPLVNNFEVPSWAGKPPPGLHLDVLKDGKMIQKLMIDEKKCYFFGRNKQLCDFTIDHSSCSRVHSALVWHRHLSRPFLIDLGSTHGTYVGHIRLESKKPQHIPIDSEIHFGASTRMYVIRERPQMGMGGLDEKDGKRDDSEGNLLGLPESETELDNLTEFNTAHNRRVISVADMPDVPNPLKRKHKTVHVNFADEEEIINPEDIDPSIGRFRNLVQTTVIPTKRGKMDLSAINSGSHLHTNKHQHTTHGLYGDLPSVGSGSMLANPLSIAAKLGLPVPNLAPDVDFESHAPAPIQPPTIPLPGVEEQGPKEPKKKKYAKEAWPGKKPTHNLLV
ncbi:nuclear inhibitor of protein phosphatase 1-like [Physella acuta]|uniref:nuclear inhibitor of protein phosphatase 1-like n=1 Tax=Physella acuta TaxID=109671 RepID=UPI0027DD120B|nr:nuclear inhibitor of protein phosphatase 1-like [Physella acuta]XP_059169495.1 nuclear inhibitor of protein phosphatase 1-like [Physella acuta]